MRLIIETSLRNIRAIGIAIALALAIALGWFSACSHKSTEPHYPILPFATVRPVLDGLSGSLPAALRQPTQAKWNSWANHEDAAIRSRLDQGARDSMINLLLFGTSFTDQPRAEGLLQPEDRLLQSRLDDFLRGLRDPHGNERLAFVARNVIGHHGLKLDSPGGSEQARAFILQNLQRMTLEQRAFRQRFNDATPGSDQKDNRSAGAGVFFDRGIALDTKILASFGITAALRDLKVHAAFGEQPIRRVAVIGPGLDFTDKGFGYDFYPLQTLQPFAIYDSLIQLGLAQYGKLEIVAFDISPEVLGHLRAARERANAGESYVVQLPRELRPWAPEAIEYWRSFGTAVGQPVPPIQPPSVLKNLETRAVRIRPQVVMSCQAIDLNVVLESFDSWDKAPFDLVVATNVFVYYDAFEQALALENISTVLKPGGFLLANDWMQGPAEIPLRPVGYTPVQYGEGEFERDAIFWWRRQ